MGGGRRLGEVKVVEADKGPKWGMVRAVVRGFDGQTHTATVQPVGSISTYLQAVPVSLEVTALEVGDRVLVMMLDEHNAGDAVVVCRY